MSIMKTQREYILVKEQKGNFHETEFEKKDGATKTLRGETYSPRLG